MPFENQQPKSIIDKLKKIVGWPEPTFVSNNSAETNNPPNDLSTLSSLAREIVGKIKGSDLFEICDIIALRMGSNSDLVRIIKFRRMESDDEAGRIAIFASHDFLQLLGETINVDADNPSSEGSTMNILTVQIESMINSILHNEKINGINEINGTLTLGGSEYKIQIRDINNLSGFTEFYFEIKITSN